MADVWAYRRIGVLACWGVGVSGYRGVRVWRVGVMGPVAWVSVLESRLRQETLQEPRADPVRGKTCIGLKKKQSETLRLLRHPDTPIPLFALLLRSISLKPVACLDDIPGACLNLFIDPADVFSKNPDTHKLDPSQE